MSKPTVVVGISGGVDSSVSALLLKEQGYEVIGVFMKNWEEEQSEGGCSTAADYEDAVRICTQIGIPYYTANFVKQYWEEVFAHTLSAYQKGFTPNPDILCNREIKFKALLKRALELGADFLATGHYAQTRLTKENERQLLKGADPEKDQSYFLYTLREEPLSRALFPVGNLPKREVRAIARKHQLATAEKQDSTGICFIGERNFKQFLSTYIPRAPGLFENLSGTALGQHDGIAFYTPGQRRGLGIGGEGEAWFVAKKDISRNAVILVQGARHPALYCQMLTATELTWVSSQGMPSLPLACRAKIRYRQTDQECVITKIEEGVATVEFAIPQRAATPMQSIVFYQEEVCLGGGIILEPGPSFYEMQKPLPDVVGN